MDNFDNKHNGGDGYVGGTGNLSAFDPEKAVSSERHQMGRVHVGTAVDVFVIPGIILKGI